MTLYFFFFSFSTFVLFFVDLFRNLNGNKVNAKYLKCQWFHFVCEINRLYERNRQGHLSIQKQEIYMHTCVFEFLAPICLKFKYKIKMVNKKI